MALKMASRQRRYERTKGKNNIIRRCGRTKRNTKVNLKGAVGELMDKS